MVFLRRGTYISHWCQLNVSLAVKTAATQPKPAYAGLRNLDFPLVRAGGLGFYSRVSVAGRDSVLFQSPGLKLTPMDISCPYPMNALLKPSKASILIIVIQNLLVFDTLSG